MALRPPATQTQPGGQLWGSGKPGRAIRGRCAAVAFAAALAAQSEQQRGFRMAPTSKSYAAHPEEADASTWNDSSALPGGPRHGHHQRLHAARAQRKAGATTHGGGQRQAFHTHKQ